MAAIIHEWCGWVEKSNEFTYKMMVLNKLWIPDVLIDIIKDFLYINATEVLHRYYKLKLHRNITNMYKSIQIYVDIYGRNRLII